MALPQHHEFYTSFLRVLSDGQNHRMKDIRDKIIQDYNFTDEQIAERLPSGSTTVLMSRLGWCKTYLKKAGLLENPSHATYRITEEGLKALNDAPIDQNYLMRYAAFKQFYYGTTNQGTNTPSQPVPTPDPLQMMIDASRQINEELSENLLGKIMDNTPTFFENLVVQLVLAMGYGNGLEDQGLVTSPTKDGGIDGIITDDRLGFEKIYTQAKRIQPNSTIGTPQIQAFVGALIGHNANKGVFITTGKFTSGARSYVANNTSPKIVLIDGTTLTRLMIEYNLGVTQAQVFTVKKIDSDFFNEDE